MVGVDKELRVSVSQVVECTYEGRQSFDRGSSQRGREAHQRIQGRLINRDPRLVDPLNVGVNSEIITEQGFKARVKTTEGACNAVRFTGRHDAVIKDLDGKSVVEIKPCVRRNEDFLARNCLSALLGGFGAKQIFARERSGFGPGVDASVVPVLLSYEGSSRDGYDCSVQELGLTSEIEGVLGTLVVSAANIHAFERGRRDIVREPSFQLNLLMGVLILQSISLIWQWMVGGSLIKNGMG